MNAKCNTARVCSSSSPSESIGDPISNSGFEFFSIFPAGSTSGSVGIQFCQVKRYRCTFTPLCNRYRFPCNPLGISTFTPFCNRYRFPASTEPISVSVELSLLLVLLLSAARGTSECSLRLFDSPSCSTVASVISVSCSNLRFASQPGQVRRADAAKEMTEDGSQVFEGGGEIDVGDAGVKMTRKNILTCTWIRTGRKGPLGGRRVEV